MITVFTGCYNQGNLLPEAIESVLSQSYKDFEYILIDDGSTDDTWEIMCDYAGKDQRVHAIQLPTNSGGAGEPVNISVEEADPESLAWVWCPADDILEPNLLQLKAEINQYHPTKIQYSWGRRIDGDGHLTGTIEFRRRNPEQFREAMKTQCPIGLTGVWIPFSVFEKVGPFPENRKYSEDFYWMIQACKEGVDFLCVPEYLYRKRIHTNRTTARHAVELQTAADEIRKELGWTCDT